MNRDCCCKHHARNIIIDELGDNFDWSGREKNVQNALELLAGERDLNRLSEIINTLTSQLSKLINLRNEIDSLQEKVDKINDTYNIYGIVNTDGIYLNPYCSESKDEPYYYRTIFWDQENNRLFFPDLNGDGVIDFNDYSIAFYLKYYINKAYEEETINSLIEYLEKTPAQRSQNSEYEDKLVNIDSNFSEIAINLINKNRNLTNYDIQIINDYIKDITENKKIWKNGELIDIDQSQSGFNDYVDYKNPLLFLQMPDINEDGRLDAIDASTILSIGTKIGAGIEIDPELKKWEKGWINAELASKVLSYSALSGTGDVSWKDYMISTGVDF